MATENPFAARLLDSLTGGRELPTPLPPDPFPTFEAWMAEAVAAAKQPNPTCFSLATVDPDGRPSNRIVLCRGMDVGLGAIRFFTNYTSRKGRAIDSHQVGAACFHWDALDRQVRMEGAIVRATEAESDAYFASRPLGNRIGAWASDQSEPLTNRQNLIDRGVEALARFGITLADVDAKGDALHVPRPPHWGGLWLQADRVELWLGSPGRFHDRAVWTRSLRPRTPVACTPPNAGQKVPILEATAWSATRLQP